MNISQFPQRSIGIGNNEIVENLLGALDISSDERKQLGGGGFSRNSRDDKNSVILIHFLTCHVTNLNNMRHI